MLENVCASDRIAFSLRENGCNPAESDAFSGLLVGTALVWTGVLITEARATCFFDRPDLDRSIEGHGDKLRSTRKGGECLDRILVCRVIFMVKR